MRVGPTSGRSRSSIRYSVMKLTTNFMEENMARSKTSVIWTQRWASFWPGEDLILLLRTTSQPAKEPSAKNTKLTKWESISFQRNKITIGIISGICTFPKLRESLNICRARIKTSPGRKFTITCLRRMKCNSLRLSIECRVLRMTNQKINLSCCMIFITKLLWQARRAI